MYTNKNVLRHLKVSNWKGGQQESPAAGEMYNKSIIK